MKILVISDIHANLTALDAVISDAGNFDSVWCLGDLVGYGPDPNECIARIRSLPDLKCVIGNHDAASIGKIDTWTFNFEARSALEWTSSELNNLSTSFIEKLEDRQVLDGFTLVHGSPRHPIWEYLLDTKNATENFKNFSTRFCLLGHSHLPLTYTLDDSGSEAELYIPSHGNVIPLQKRMILNPGSVGQPRDRDPRASYALIDIENQTWEYKRVTYNIEAVQKRMTKKNLPERHITRLKYGW